MNVQSKLKLYNESNISAALVAIENGTSIRKASKIWCVPPSTLRNRISGQLPRQEAFHAWQRLSPIQETLLADWVLLQVSLGVPITHLQLRHLAQRISWQKGINQEVGKR